MLCQHCKKNIATYNYISIVNNQKFATHLCDSCYANLYGDLNSKATGDILAGLFGESDNTQKTCPVCGSTYEDYENSGLLGCASCYDVFKSELIPSIMRIQGKINHVGKVGVNNDELGLHRRLKSLQEDLERALKNKNYIQASVLNSVIDQVKKRLYGGKNDN